jgi:hypothetical protein
MDQLQTEKLIAHEVARYKQWLLGATKPRTTLLPKATFGEHPDRSCSLKNRKFVKYLQWEDQDFGINLGWTDDATDETGNKVARWFFARNGSSEQPIRFGETVAVGYGKSPSFLRYEERTTGINLGWTEEPAFEWKLLGGPADDPVHTQEWIAIFNQKDGECLVAFDRNVGGDVGWPSSRRWGTQITDELEDLAEGLTEAGWKAAQAAATKALLTAALA